MTTTRKQYSPTSESGRNVVEASNAIFHSRSNLLDIPLKL